MSFFIKSELNLYMIRVIARICLMFLVYHAYRIWANRPKAALSK